MDMVDTTKETGRGMLALYKKFDHLRIGGYIQPQFQLAESKGVKAFEGGDFSSQCKQPVHAEKEQGKDRLYAL
jgi:hypothetical protein